MREFLKKTFEFLLTTLIVYTVFINIIVAISFFNEPVFSIPVLILAIPFSYGIWGRDRGGKDET